MSLKCMISVLNFIRYQEWIEITDQCHPRMVDDTSFDKIDENFRTFIFWHLCNLIVGLLKRICAHDCKAYVYRCIS